MHKFQVVVVLDGTLESFTPQRESDLVADLSRQLGANAAGSKVVKATAGSIVAVVELAFEERLLPALTARRERVRKLKGVTLAGINCLTCLVTAGIVLLAGSLVDNDTVRVGFQAAVKGCC